MGPWFSSTLGRVATSAQMKTIWTSSGMLRIVSMKTLHMRLTIQLLDSRPTPISTPRMVAATIPPAAMRMVLTAPAHNARPAVSGSVSMPSRRSLPSPMLRKSYLISIPWRSRFSRACVVRKNRAKTTSRSVNTWASHLTTVTSR